MKGYETVDGQLQPRHATGQYCECDDCVGREDDMLLRFEADELDDAETVALFQHLIDSGEAWTLQGYYRRRARDMIRNGACTDTHGVLRFGGKS